MLNGVGAGRLVWIEYWPSMNILWMSFSLLGKHERTLLLTLLLIRLQYLNFIPAAKHKLVFHVNEEMFILLALCHDMMA